jgi:hypothetical protein
VTSVITVLLKTILVTVLALLLFLGIEAMMVAYSSCESIATCQNRVQFYPIPMNYKSNLSKAIAPWSAHVVDYKQEPLHKSCNVVKITLEVSDELSEQLAQVGERLPELLALSLQQPPLPSRIYQYILDFLVNKPTPEQILAFRPNTEMQERLKTLLTRHKAGELTPTEQKELDEFERIEHLIVMLKAGSLPQLVDNE